MSFKAFNWKWLANSVPSWMESTIDGTNGSRLFDILARPLDRYVKTMRHIPNDFLATTSEFREPKYIKKISSNGNINSIDGYLNREPYSIELKESETIKDFYEPQPTRIEFYDERIYPDRLVGVNFYTEDSGYPYYTEILTDRECNEVGSAIRLDPNNNISRSYIDRKTQDYTSTEGQERIEVDMHISLWVVENNINYRNFKYDKNKTYIVHKTELDNIPIDGTVKLKDIVQNPTGHYINSIEGNRIYMGGGGNAYKGLRPKMRTWFEVNGKELTIYNPISKYYVVEYDYTDMKTGPVTRTESYRSVNKSSARLILNSIVPPSGQAIITKDDITSNDPEEYELKLIKEGVTDEVLLPGSKYPPDSKLAIEISGVISLDIRISDGVGSVSMVRRLSKLVDNPDDIKFDFDNLYFSSEDADDETSTYINYDQEGWPIVNVISNKDIVRLHLPYKYNGWINITISDEVVLDPDTRMMTRQTKTMSSIQDLPIEMYNLVRNSLYYNINLYEVTLNTGISHFDINLANELTGIVLGSYFYNRISIYDKKFNHVLTFPVGGYTKNASNVYTPMNIRGSLGPIVTIDEYIYYIIWKKDAQVLMKIGPNYTKPEQIHEFKELSNHELISDITYDGEYFSITCGNKLKRYKLFFDWYYFDTDDQTILIREKYDSVRIS